VKAVKVANKIEAVILDADEFALFMRTIRLFVDQYEGTYATSNEELNLAEEIIRQHKTMLEMK
jgi:hypothetical protein